MNWKYVGAGILMLGIAGLTPLSIIAKIPLGFIIQIGLLFFGVVVIIAGIFKG